MPKPISSSLAPVYAGAVASVFFWGTNFNAGAYVIGIMTPIAAALERFGIATALLLLISGATGRLRLQALKRNWAIYVVLGLVGVTLFNLSTFIGLQGTTPINGALIMATTPLSTMILALLLERERLDAWRAFGLLSGLLGVVLVITRGNLAALADSGISHGDAVILLGSLAWSLNTVLMRRYVKDATPIETTTFSMLFGTLGLGLLAGLFDHPIAAMAAAPAGVHLAIAYLGIFGSMAAYLLWFKAIGRIGSARTATFFNLVPVFTMIVSTVMGVPPNPWQLVGAATVVVGVLFASGALRKTTPGASAPEPLRTLPAPPCPSTSPTR